MREEKEEDQKMKINQRQKPKFAGSINKLGKTLEENASALNIFSDELGKFE